jgi:hypothetical protein
VIRYKQTAVKYALCMNEVHVWHESAKRLATDGGNERYFCRSGLFFEAQRAKQRLLFQIDEIERTLDNVA